MKLAKYLLGLWILILFLPACSSAEKAAHERRNLMMPKKSELKRNQKYKPTKKAYKAPKQKKKKRK
ncbi:MAG TPA: hypothetical protein DDX98_08430 [Bacteroidales bacterium]|jgi:hypothetical protein|nr:hypothetical protein [Bacteroidales bacterium]